MNIEESAERVKKWYEFYRLREKTNTDFLFSIAEKDIPIEAIETLLTAYEKQQKEIEDLKEKIKNFTIEDENIYLQFGEITEKKRWQDKIKAKLKELKQEKSEYEDSPEWELFDYLTAQIEILEGVLREE